MLMLEVSFTVIIRYYSIQCHQITKLNFVGLTKIYALKCENFTAKVKRFLTFKVVGASRRTAYLEGLSGNTTP